MMETTINPKVYYIMYGVVEGLYICIYMSLNGMS